MPDEPRGLDVEVSCENVEIAVFSQAVKFTRERFVSIPPLEMSSGGDVVSISVLSALFNCFRAVLHWVLVQKFWGLVDGSVCATV